MSLVLFQSDLWRINGCFTLFCSSCARLSIEICWNCLKNHRIRTEAGHKNLRSKFSMDSVPIILWQSLMDRNSSVSAPLIELVSSSWSGAGLEQTEGPFQSSDWFFLEWNQGREGPQLQQGKPQARHPSSIAAARAHSHTLNQFQDKTGASHCSLPGNSDRVVHSRSV